MNETHYLWSQTDERSLARVVRFDSLPPKLQLPAYINREALFKTEGMIGVTAQLYELLRKQDINYDPEPLNRQASETVLIRTPTAILAEQRATSLDVTILFAAMALANNLYPIVVIAHDHAFLGISSTLSSLAISGWERGKLTHIKALPISAPHECFFLECTGALRTSSRRLARPVDQGENIYGLLSFERACEVGKEHIIQQSQSNDSLFIALHIFDLQTTYGFAPILLTKSTGQSITTISAPNSQGFINQPTGPVTQYFGSVRTINKVEGDYTEGSIDKREGTFVGGHQFNLSGSFSDANLNLASTLTNVSQSRGHESRGNQNALARAQECLAELRTEIKLVSVEHTEAAEEIMKRIDNVVAEIGKPTPDQEDVRYNLSRLHQAIEQIPALPPTVSRLVEQITAIARGKLKHP